MLHTLSYKDQRKCLQLTRLDRRRDGSDLIEAYKIISGVYNVQSDGFFEFDQCGRSCHLKKNYLKEELNGCQGNLF